MREQNQSGIYTVVYKINVHFTVFFIIDPVRLLMIQITTVINTLTAITTITTLITLTVTITVTGESVDTGLKEDYTIGVKTINLLLTLY